MNTQEVKEGYTTISLDSLFNTTDLLTLTDLISRKDKNGIKAFLLRREDKLERQGIVAMYLYYQIEFRFNL